MEPQILLGHTLRTPNLAVPLFHVGWTTASNAGSSSIVQTQTRSSMGLETFGQLIGFTLKMGPCVFNGAMYIPVSVPFFSALLSFPREKYLTPALSQFRMQRGKRAVLLNTQCVDFAMLPYSYLPTSCSWCQEGWSPFETDTIASGSSARSSRRQFSSWVGWAGAGRFHFF